MKGKTVETVPFEYTYYLVHRETKKKEGPFKSIGEVKNFKCDKYRYSGGYAETMKIGGVHIRHEVEYRTLFSGARTFGYELRNPFCIVTHLGDVVHPDEIKAASGGYVYRNNGWEARNKKRNAIEVGLLKRKGDGNKIKSDWAYRESWSNYSQEVDYTNDSFGYFRRISTTAEHRANAGCDADYGQGFVRGARRGHNLPNSWDDVSCGAYGLKACWKHNSKRRKQWKPK